MALSAIDSQGHMRVSESRQQLYLECAIATSRNRDNVKLRMARFVPGRMSTVPIRAGFPE